MSGTWFTCPGTKIRAINKPLEAFFLLKINEIASNHNINMTKWIPSYICHLSRTKMPYHLARFLDFLTSYCDSGWKYLNADSLYTVNNAKAVSFRGLICQLRWSFLRIKKLFRKISLIKLRLESYHFKKIKQKWSVSWKKNKKKKQPIRTWEGKFPLGGANDFWVRGLGTSFSPLVVASIK